MLRCGNYSSNTISENWHMADNNDIRISSEGIIHVQVDNACDGLSFVNVPDYGVEVFFQKDYVKYGFYDTDGDGSFRVIDTKTSEDILTLSLNSNPTTQSYSLSVKNVSKSLRPSDVSLSKIFQDLYLVKVRR